MLSLGKERNELSVVSDQIGSPTYAIDLAEVILGIVNNKDYQDKNQSTQVCHYSNEGEISWYEFAKEIFKLAEVDCKVSPIIAEQYPTLARRPMNTIMDKNKITKAFGVDTPDWKESLNTCMTILKEQQ
jgi:dTDP-4-dehydrorhamnose reductase